MLWMCLRPMDWKKQAEGVGEVLDVAEPNIVGADVEGEVRDIEGEGEVLDVAEGNKVETEFERGVLDIGARSRCSMWLRR